MALTLRIRRVDDMHQHLRDGDMLANVAPIVARSCARAIVMPNLKTPVRDKESVLGYRERILRIIPEGFEPLMTMKLMPDTTPEDIVRAAPYLKAVKLYYAGTTTNSHDGVTLNGLNDMDPVLEAIERCGLVLCIHGEHPDVTIMSREYSYLSYLAGIVERFPRLRIVLEHVSDGRTVDWMLERDYPNLAATITVHHLYDTIDDVLSGGIRPHAYCMPIPKTPYDRDRLLRAAISGDRRFFFGSDSAPHPRSEKESQCGSAGVFSAPVMVPALAALFESVGAMDYLEDFTSRFGAEFYGLPLNQGQITLLREPWTVPVEYGGVVPFMAGRELKWQIQA